MRKMLKISAFVLALLVSVPALFGLSKLIEADATYNGRARGNVTRDPAPFVPVGDLNGGIRGAEAAYGGFMIKSPSALVDLSDSDLYIRIKNNESVTRWPMVHVASDWFVNRVVTANGQVVERYDASGNLLATAAVNEWGYFELPANFDGFIKIAWTGFANDWQDAFSNTRVNAVYFEADNYDVSIGDIFTESAKFFDGSERYADEFANWSETWTGATLTLLEGSKVDVYVPVGDLNGGIRGAEAAYGGFMIKSPSALVDLSDSDLYIRIKNNESVTRWPMVHVASDWFVNRVVTANGQVVERYDASGNLLATAAVNEWGYFELPANFDGFIKIAWAGFANDWQDAFSNTTVNAVYFEADNYDVSIGDIFTEGAKFFDGSERYASEFSTWSETWTGATLTLLEGSKSTVFTVSGDLNGGVRATESGYGGFMVKASALVNLSKGGLYIRIKNNEATIKYPMIHVASDWFVNRVVTANGQIIDRYDASGELIDSTTVNEFGYFELPASFDGFIKVNWEGFANDWLDGFSNTTVNAVYFEADSYDISVGDIFSEESSFFDGSEHYASEFPTWLETWTSAQFTLLEGSKPAPVVLFDYTQITYQVGLDNGVQVSAKQNQDNTVFSTGSINFAQNLDLSAGEAVAISFKANGTYAFGLEFYDKDDNALMMPLPGDAATKPIYFIKDGIAASINHTTGDPNTIHGQNGEGTMVIEKAFLAQKSGTEFDWAHIASIKIRIHTFYDHGIVDVFGDIGTVDQATLSYTCVFDVSELLNWSTYFHADDEYVVMKQYSIPKASLWIGDVKILDSLNYRDDEEMEKAITYDDGNNPCSYHRQDGGIFIHNGPYETGHAYGSYMCLAFFDQGATTDRLEAYRMVNEQKEYAKGMTFYAKNLSNKEIGVTLQFDETIPGKSYTERWCVVGYPALYYAWDVNTNAEYMFYSKSDQVQIPVGFEGYIRVPFESYSVPEWNKGQEGVDEVLDLDNFSGSLFFTSDNTRYEDLEYVIKDLGMYFNETRKGNMFDNSHTIKANMGL